MTPPGQTAPPLTPRQRAILAFIRDYSAAYGYSPSMREIADHLAGSTSAVAYNLDQMAAAGYLRRAPGLARSIVLTREVTP